MTHPQTKADLIKEHCSVIAKNACCAFTAMWLAGYEPEDSEAIVTVAKAIEAKVLGNDCTVIWQPFFLWLTGRKIFVEFRKINSLSDLLDVPGRCAVKFTYNGKSHWVGVENCKVAFNSLENSVCVNKGKPTEARIIKWGLKV